MFIAKIQRKARVAAYCRVSLNTEGLKHSMSTQVNYYSTFIRNHPDWEFAGIYADQGVTGTIASKRAEFQRMIKDAENGKINIILTKSIQRFARNTVDLLVTVRHLKEIGVEVRFEKENISTFEESGELMLSILASVAQAESNSIGENIKWSKRKGFAKGKASTGSYAFGYRWQDGKLVVQPDEAESVKLIFEMFLDGKNTGEIIRELERRGVQPSRSCEFTRNAILYILSNIAYTGGMLLQKTYSADPISKKRKINAGTLKQHWFKDSHEAIIPDDVFWQAQQKLAEMHKTHKRVLSVFSGKIICSCGKVYYKQGRWWLCRSKIKKGGSCGSKHLPHECVVNVCADLLGEQFEETFRDEVKYIRTIDPDILEFHMADGSIERRRWKR